MWSEETIYCIDEKIHVLSVLFWSAASALLKCSLVEYVCGGIDLMKNSMDSQINKPEIKHISYLVK